MIKPSILVEVKNGKPVVALCSLDADEVLAAYKDSKADAYAFIRPVASKRKRSIAPDAPEPIAKKAVKSARSK